MRAQALIGCVAVWGKGGVVAVGFTSIVCCVTVVGQTNLRISRAVGGDSPGDRFEGRPWLIIGDAGRWTAFCGVGCGFEEASRRSLCA